VGNHEEEVVEDWGYQERLGLHWGAAQGSKQQREGQAGGLKVLGSGHPRQGSVVDLSVHPCPSHPTGSEAKLSVGLEPKAMASQLQELGCCWHCL